MAKYTVQAPDGSVITIEGPDGASQNEIIQQAQSLYNKPQPGQDKSAKDYVKDFAKASASLADMGINAVTGTLDWAAYPLARASGLSPEQATKETTSPKDYLGRAFGITQDPAYQNEASRQILGYVGENMERSVAEPISQVTGLPQQDVSNMLGSATMMVPGAARAAKPAMQATGTAIADIARGAIGRGTGYIAEPGAVPKGYQVPSSRIPLSNEFTKPEDWAKFQRGELPYGEFPPTTPIQELPSNKLEKAALALSGGEIPAAGQGFKAFGERLGETYRNPITAAADIGSMFLTGGVPVITAGRTGLAAAQAAADALLARKGFDPALPSQMAGYKSGKIPMPGQAPVAGPVVPPQYPLTVQGPGQTLPPTVMPMGTAPRNVNIEGQSFNLPYQINTSQSQGARAPQSSIPVPEIKPVAPTATPKEISQQVAASKIQQPAPQFSPEQQAMLDKIRARGQQPKPAPETTVAPVVPEGTQALPAERWTPEERLAVERARLQAEQQKNPPKEPTPKEEADYKKELEATEKQVTAKERGNIIKEWVAGNKIVSSEVLDIGKNAYGRSNLAQAQAKDLLKAGIDEIPVIPGASSKQVIEAMHGYIKQNKPEMFKAKRGPKNVSKMMTDEDKNKFFNTIKSSGESELDRKVAGLDQAGRDTLLKSLKSQLNEANKDTIQPFIDTIEKYRTKK